MFSSVQNVIIAGIAAAVPKTSISNDSFAEQFGEKTVKKQKRITGINNRHISGGEVSAADLCVDSAKRLLEHVKWEKDSVSAMIFVSQTPNFIIPSTSFYIHKELGLSDDCLTFDINLGCSGYVVGLQTIINFVNQQKQSGRVLLLVGDTLSKYIESDDITNCLIFGDAGTATALEFSEKSSFFFETHSIGTSYQEIMIKENEKKFYMNGIEVFNFTISDVVTYAKNFLHYLSENGYDIDYYVFHQAQKYIVDNISRLLEIQPERILNSYENYGNTSGASIPLSICAAYEKLQDKEEHNMFLCGFGVGLSCGCAYVKIKTQGIMPIGVL